MMPAPVGTVGHLRRRAWNKWRRYSIARYARRPFTLPGRQSFVSFTFDDFPRTALEIGGTILERHGARGTYFVSCQMLDGPSVSGDIASRHDLRSLIERGHELGCHTFEHLDGRVASVAQFDSSIDTNRRALNAIVPGVDLPIFAYPLEGPVLPVKRAVGTHFAACRGGGQTFNRGSVDLNLLQAFFLDWKSRDNMDAIVSLLADNARHGGWLIFATHDVADEPSLYGCTPECFDAVVRAAGQSGASVLPMMSVCREVGIAR